jgi:hypothetical protein
VVNAARGTGLPELAEKTPLFLRRPAQIAVSCGNRARAEVLVFAASGA